jgi:light-regulated signal transduction histidine kinase (bacteriophytochrome)
LDVVLAPTSINSVVTWALQDLDTEITSRGAHIAVQSMIPEVLATRPLLQQVCGHLLTNALKFVAQDIAPDIRITAEERGAYVRATIADNGIGIASKYHERIFRPFERLHGEDTYAGTGIGLAVVRRAVHRMRGRVGVESEAHEGSRFWFELERAQPYA